MSKSKDRLLKWIVYFQLKDRITYFSPNNRILLVSGSYTFSPDRMPSAMIVYFTYDPFALDIPRTGDQTLTSKDDNVSGIIFAISYSLYESV